MASTPERRQAIERIQSTLRSEAAQSGTIDACVGELTILGAEIIADIEAQLAVMADPSEPTAA